MCACHPPPLLPERTPLSRACCLAQCRRELYAALDRRVPLILVHEADEAKGGAPLEEMQRECLRCCTDNHAMEADEVCQGVFYMQRRRPVAWVRVRDFQLVSLRLVHS